MTSAFVSTTSISIPLRPTPTAKDIGPGLVYENNGVKVTAIEVDHGDKIKPGLSATSSRMAADKVVRSGDDQVR